MARTSEVLINFSLKVQLRELSGGLLEFGSIFLLFIGSVLGQVNLTKGSSAKLFDEFEVFAHNQVWIVKKKYLELTFQKSRIIILTIQKILCFNFICSEPCHIKFTVLIFQFIKLKNCETMLKIIKINLNKFENMNAVRVIICELLPSLYQVLHLLFLCLCLWLLHFLNVLDFILSDVFRHLICFLNQVKSELFSNLIFTDWFHQLKSNLTVDVSFTANQRMIKLSCSRHPIVMLTASDQLTLRNEFRIKIMTIGPKQRLNRLDLDSHPCVIVITSTNNRMVIFHLSGPVAIMIATNQWLIDLDVGGLIKIVVSSAKQRSLFHGRIEVLPQSLLQFKTFLFNHQMEVFSILFHSSFHFFHLLLNLFKDVPGSNLTIGLHVELRHYQRQWWDSEFIGSLRYILDGNWLGLEIA